MPPKVNKIEAEIRRLSKLEGNKTCADCPEKVPGYVDLTHNVFICTKCSGIHREFQFKVKGVSMTVFTAEDVEGLAAGGNENFNSIYLANLNPRDYAIPNGSDVSKLKEFIRMKYIDKRWHRDGRGGSTGFGADFTNSTNHAATATSNPSTTENSSHRISLKLNTNMNNSKATAVNRRASTGSVDIKKPTASDNLTGDLDLLSISDSNNQHQTQNSFDPFGSNPKSTANDPFASNNKSVSQDPFGSTHQPAGKDPFGNHDFNANKSDSLGGGFDPFSNTGPNKGVDPFDPFGSGGQLVKTQGGGFDAFGTSGSHNTDQNSFDAFNNTPTQAPMPFIKLNPPAAYQPVAEVVPAVAQPPKKDFGAFDDLLTPMTTATSDVNHQSNNPFDNAFPGTGVGAPRPQYAHQAYNAPYGYAAQPPPGYSPYAPGAPQNYPPAYGYPNAPGYPPQYPTYGSGGYGGQPQQPQHYSVPGQAVPQVAPVQVVPQPQQVAAPPQAPDPFAAMSNLAWNAVGGAAPNSTPTNQPKFQSAPVAIPFPPIQQQVQSPPAQQNPPQSVNPFDLF